MFLVATSVVRTQQVFKGNMLVVKLQEPKSKRNNEAPERENIDKSRTVSVSDLPEEASESDVHIHFQKNKNGENNVSIAIRYYL